MSEPQVGAEECSSLGAPEQTIESYPNRDARLGAIRISRALPIRDRRLIGPWCFLDRFGPLAFEAGAPMDVPPHPHIGLQTVSWLTEGEVRHSDSLGYQAVVRPGGVNVMTAGRGIAHAEETPAENSGRLGGVQLWIALPGAERDVEPGFEHVAQVPAIDRPGARIQVFAGAYGGRASPARHFSPLAGADVALDGGAALDLELDPLFEHGLLLLEGDCRLASEVIEDRRLYYLAAGRTAIALSSQIGGRVLLIGGPPFPEKILMWWNFVARTPEEIAAARADWETGRRFGEVIGEHGPRLDAPELVHFARPNPIS